MFLHMIGGVAIHYLIEFNVCQKMIQFNIGFNIARVGQSVESALIALAAIFFSHSAYFNNF